MASFLEEVVHVCFQFMVIVLNRTTTTKTITSSSVWRRLVLLVDFTLGELTEVNNDDVRTNPRQQRKHVSDGGVML